jgi:DNA (cytosine-5)-methyltransferase 1
MLRVIREVTPRYVVGENVLGLTNWNGGLVFDEVHTDLESAGYEVAAVVIPAAAVNAPHGRDRVWFVAKRVVADAVCGSDGNDGGEIVGAPSEIRRGTSVNVPNQFCGTGVVADASDNEYGLQTEGWLGMEQNPLDRRERKKETNGFGNDGEGRVVADAKCGGGVSFGLNLQPEESNGKRIERNGGKRYATDTDGERFNSGKFERTNWKKFPTKSPVCGGNDGVPDQLDGITFSKWRAESLKAYGNAIVPQVAYEIFKTIQRIEDGQT